MAELGFFGVRVITCTQTPRRNGFPSNAGDFDLMRTLRRPLRASEHFPPESEGIFSAFRPSKRVRNVSFSRLSPFVQTRAQSLNLSKVVTHSLNNVEDDIGPVSIVPPTSEPTWIARVQSVRK